MYIHHYHIWLVVEPPLWKYEFVSWDHYFRSMENRKCSKPSTSILPSGYLTVCHGKSPFLIGKPSISMGHLYHGELLNNQHIVPINSWDPFFHALNRASGCLLAPPTSPGVRHLSRHAFWTCYRSDGIFTMKNWETGKNGDFVRKLAWKLISQQLFTIVHIFSPWKLGS